MTDEASSNTQADNNPTPTPPTVGPDAIAQGFCKGTGAALIFTTGNITVGHGTESACNAFVSFYKYLSGRP